jgi:hypothetical protein
VERLRRSQVPIVEMPEEGRAGLAVNGFEHRASFLGPEIQGDVETRSRVGVEKVDGRGVSDQNTAVVPEGRQRTIPRGAFGSRTPGPEGERTRIDAPSGPAGFSRVFY